MSRAPYKLLSVLLQYPDDRVTRGREDLGAAIAALPRSGQRRLIERFWDWFGAAAATEVQQRYVETFDLQRRSSLYLTFYTEGDTRKRGQALLRLKHVYRAAGLEMEGPELPDFLPLMLEFAAIAPDGVGTRLLREHRAGLELLRLHLTEIQSPYRFLVEAVTAGLPRLAPPEIAIVGELLAAGPPSEQVGLR